MRDPQDHGLHATDRIGRLRRRADFLRVAKGKRLHVNGMTVQAAPAAQDGSGVCIGYTLTRKVGSAVVRNRIRRRLKAAVRLSPDLPVRDGHDYVIIGRTEALRLSFEVLKREMARAVTAVHDAGRSGRPRPRKAPTDKRPTRTVPAP